MCDRGCVTNGDSSGHHHRAHESSIRRAGGFFSADQISTKQPAQSPVPRHTMSSECGLVQSQDFMHVFLASYILPLAKSHRNIYNFVEFYRNQYNSTDHSIDLYIK